MFQSTTNRGFISMMMTVCLLASIIVATEASMVGARRLRLMEQQNDIDNEHGAHNDHERAMLRASSSSSSTAVDNIQEDDSGRRHLQAVETPPSMSMSMSMSMPMEVMPGPSICLAEGEACEVLEQSCCGELVCVADITVAPVPAVSYSCAPPFEPRCNVCGTDDVTGSDLVVTNPLGTPSLVIPELVFTCAQIEEAGATGVFPAQLCGFIPGFIVDECQCGLPPV
jgi:hypothetical protein